MLRPGRGGSHGNLPTSHGSSNGFGVGYGDMPSHSYEDADQKYGRRRRSSGSGSFSAAVSPSSVLKNPMVLLLLTCGILFLTTLYYRGMEGRLLQKLGVDSLQQALEQMEQAPYNNKRNLQDQRALEDRTRRLEEENRKLEIETQELKQKTIQSKKENENEHHSKTVQHYAKRDAAWKHQVQKLQNATVRESKRTALERFGPGPHRVKFSLHLPYDDDDHLNTDTIKSFVLEMAPLEQMPHAVHLFLEQVSHRLWDDTWFYLNGPHVLQAGPQSYEDEQPDEVERAKLAEFERLQLKTLAFPEYSALYPHTKWTVGFTGRPGGPDWYINKSDNIKTHGPGGQRQHALMEQADPCFARVVEGFDTLEELFKLEVYHDEMVEYANFFVEPVAIVEARIVTSGGEEEKQRQEEEQKQKKKEEEDTNHVHGDVTKEEHARDHHRHHEHHPKKPLVDHHRVENDDDDIMTEEDWEYEDEDEWHEHEYHEDHEEYH